MSNQEKVQEIISQIIYDLNKKECYMCKSTTYEKIFGTVLLNKKKKPSFKIVDICTDCSIRSNFSF